jgi:hypothetical protein
VTYHAVTLTNIPGLRRPSSGTLPKSAISARHQRSTAISAATRDCIILTERAASLLLSSWID